MGIADIKNYETFAKIEPLNKGWSSDKKYYIESVSGQKLLLRVADISEYDRKKAEYGMMERAAALGIPTSLPVDFGLCNDGKSVYSLLTWCEGDDVEAVLPSMPEIEQYTLGTKAGELLRKIHALPAPENAEPWGARFRRKVQGRIDFYNASPIQSENGGKIIRCLQDRQDLLDNRPQTFNHGDFGTSNLIVTLDDQIGVIDFNYFNSDHGDPWWEFDSIPWGKEPFAHFYTGLINGYFGSEPPREFFEVLSYYFAYDALAALCDTSKGEQGEPEDGRRHMENIVRWFDDMKNPVPIWYKV